MYYAQIGLCYCQCAVICDLLHIFSLGEVSAVVKPQRAPGSTLPLSMALLKLSSPPRDKQILVILGRDRYILYVLHIQTSHMT